MKKSTIIAASVGVFLVAGILTVRYLSLEKVRVAQPVRGVAVQAVYATGTVEATVMMPIAARGSARLMELNVDEGSHVKKGQVLARLEDDDLREMLREAQAREAFANKEFERNRELVKRGAGAREALQRSKSDWDAATAAVSAAEAKLRFMRLEAPEDGHIIRRDGEVGELIAANQPVFWLSCCAPLRISSEVDEEDIALVQPGQEVLIRADAFSDQSFKGEVLSITPKGDPIARSYRVRIGFKEETPLLIGMTAETNILIREVPNALLIPSSAFVQGKVWLVKSGELVHQDVKVGVRGPEQTEILEGVVEGDEVAISPSEDWLAGESVRSKRMDSPQAPAGEK